MDSQKKFSKVFKRSVTCLVRSRDNEYVRFNREVNDAEPGGFWEVGVGCLWKKESTWPIKLTLKEDNFEGEL